MHCTFKYNISTQYINLNYKKDIINENMDKEYSFNNNINKCFISYCKFLFYHRFLIYVFLEVFENFIISTYFLFRI